MSSTEEQTQGVTAEIPEEVKASPGRSVARAGDDARRQHAEEQAQEFASRYRLPYVDLRTTPIDYALVERLPVDFLIRNQVIPLEGGSGLGQAFAVADPTNYELVDELEQ
jgi:hypothetical protein